jgi:uncharacterized protein involved in exopolysaccharide biosynthesis
VMQDGERADRDDAIRAHEILSVLGRDKWSLLAAALIGLVLSVIYAMLAPNWFRSEVLLKPVEQKSGGMPGGASDAAGALANLTGINLNAGNTTGEPIAIFTSREFTGAFIQDHNLLPLIFSRRWDAAANHWKPPALFGFLGTPDIRDGEEYFKNKIITVVENKKTGLVTLAVEWKDPKAAADWANEMVDRLNERMRQRALKEANYNVNYLEQQLALTNLVPLQQSIGRVLESELQKLLLAQGNPEYSFRIVDHAQPSKHRVGVPKPLLVLEGLIAGAFLWSLVLISRHLMRRNI